MSDELRLTFKDKKTAWSLIQTVLFPALGKVLTGEAEWVLLFKRVTRSIEQNRKLHAILSDISKRVLWNGKKLNVVVWKRLCTAAWLREVGENPELIPALDGNGFDVIYEKTSGLSVDKCSSLIEWCLAFGAQQGVKFSVNED